VLYLYIFYWYGIPGGDPVIDPRPARTVIVVDVDGAKALDQIRRKDIHSTRAPARVREITCVPQLRVGIVFDSWEP
jgi:hypothetical protein